MEINELRNKRALDLTGGELAEIIISRLKENTDSEKQEKRYVRGINGIMDIFQCSRSKASNIKKSGIIDKAISSTGRVFLVDVDMAVELVGKNKGGRKFNRR